MKFSLARQRFYQATHQEDGQINLERAALYVAQEEYPDLDVEEYLSALDTMAADIKEQLPEEFYPLRILQTINRYLYDDLGFQGNSDNYYDPRNSFLNQVIDRRMGIPITLSLVYLAIAKRIDFPMTGIGLPGHFLIRPTVAEMEVFVDPFHQGEILFPEDCQNRMTEVFGQPVELRPGFLQPVTAHQFLARMLTNLKMIYINQGIFQKAVAAIERILLLYPDAPLELRDRGILYYRMNRRLEARQDLTEYLSLSPDAADAMIIQQLLDTIGKQPE